MFFGSRPISKPRINKLRHGKLTILTAELCALVFITEEMALGTLNGKKNNKHDDGLEPVKSDEACVQAIVGKFRSLKKFLGLEFYVFSMISDQVLTRVADYVMQAKGVSGSDVEKSIFTAIAHKLNNFKRTDEGKAMRERAKAQRRDLTAATVQSPNE